MAANTADTLTVSGSFSKAPVVGDTFVIEQPAVTLEYPTGMVFTGGGLFQVVEQSTLTAGGVGGLIPEADATWTATFRKVVPR